MSIKLASPNYKEVEFAPSGAILKDAFIPAATLGGSLNGFAGIANLAAGSPGTVIVKAEKAIATKAAADTLAFAPGEIVRYNATAGKVTKTGSDPAIGYAKKAAVAADTEVVIEFDGAMGIASGESITLSQITDLGDLSITMNQVSDLGDLALGDLADVNLAGVTDNDRLAYDLATTSWIPEAVAD